METTIKKPIVHNDKHELKFIDKLEHHDDQVYFWILEEDYATVFNRRNKIDIHHLYGRDRLVFNTVITRFPDIRFKLLPPYESAIVYTADDSTLPILEFKFKKIGVDKTFGTDYSKIFNHKTMKQLEELCQRHDNEIDFELHKTIFSITYYTEILVFSTTDLESDVESDIESNEKSNSDDSSNNTSHEESSNKSDTENTDYSKNKNNNKKKK